jgi:hypothetical protein
VSYQQKDGRGSLFKNERKREGKKDPDYTGSITVNGVERWLSAWVEKPEGKKSYLSLNIGEPKGGKKDDHAKAAAADPEFDDDLPF